jgi:hypothetical protein
MISSLLLIENHKEKEIIIKLNNSFTLIIRRIQLDRI